MFDNFGLFTNYKKNTKSSFSSLRKKLAFALPRYPHTPPTAYTWINNNIHLLIFLNKTLRIFLLKSCLFGFLRPEQSEIGNILDKPNFSGFFGTCEYNACVTLLLSYCGSVLKVFTNYCVYEMYKAVMLKRLTG